MLPPLLLLHIRTTMDVADSKDRCHGHQLHLHAPLLSTRRFAAVPRLNTKRCDSADTNDTCRRVPFLWERVPGTPKFTENADEPPPTPKLPPGRLHHHPSKSKEVGLSTGSSDNNNNNKDDDHDDGDETYLDAMDVMSFFESSGAQERGRGLDWNAVQSRGNLSPGFILNRFLPAANALAFSSTPKKLSKKGTKKESSKHPSTPTRVRTFSPPSSCGLLLFPLGLKQLLCGSKSPVRSCSFRKCNPPADGGTCSSKRSSASRDEYDAGKCSERVWRVESPCESWLSNAVSSIDEKRG